jgi:spermidine synthase
MVYAVNTLGAILGVIVAVHFLMDRFGLKATVLAGAAIDVGLGVMLLLAIPAAGERRRLPRAGVAALVVFLASAFAFDIDPRKSASGVFRSGSARISPEDKVVYHRDGKTATVDVVEYRGARAIRTNGKVDAAISTGTAASGDEYTMSLLALLPLGHKPDARTAAVIGFGSGMSTATLLGSPRLERVDTIEIEPAMVEGARLFRPFVEAAYADPRSRIVIDDAKSYFARGRERYDIIVSEPSNPWVSGVASLFTEEFYRRLNAYMNDGAVLSQWLHTYEMDSPTLASILKAVSKTFPEFMIYTTIDTDIVVIARKGGPPGPFQAEALSSEALKPLLARLKIADADVVRRRTIGNWRTLGPYFEGYAIAANSDYFPIVEQRASRTRFTRERVNDLGRPAGAPCRPRDARPPHSSAGGAPGHVAGSHPEAVTASAWAAHDVLLRTAGAQAPLTEPHQISASLARQWMNSCRTELGFNQVFPQLLDMASTVNPGLHPDVASALWRRVRETPCARELPPEHAAWLELFAAVGARDAAAISQVGGRSCSRRSAASATP